MHFLFVDQIIKDQPGKVIQGIKHITPADVYLTQGRNKQAVLMPSIVTETMGQLAAWSVMRANDFTLRPVAGVASEVQLIADASVGDTLYIESTIDHVDDQAVEYHSVATINDKPIAIIESAIGPMLPMQDFIDPSVVRQQYDLIYRESERPEIPTSIQSLTLNKERPLLNNQLAQFDHIIDWQAGESITAQKNISILAPYFVDHFPRKPVLPLTILMSCNVDLAKRFIARVLTEEHASQFHAKSMRRIKMRDFVQPGDVLIQHCHLKQQTEKQFIFKLQSEVNGKRVCVAELVMERE